MSLFTPGNFTMAQQFTLAEPDLLRLGKFLAPELSHLLEGRADVELVPRQIVSDQVHIIQHHRYGMYSRFFSGAGGVGKTTALIVLVAMILRDNETSQDPVLVIYHPQCGNLVSMDHNTAAEELWQSLLQLNLPTLHRTPKFDRLLQLIRDDCMSPHDRWLQFIQLVRKNDDWRVLFALDQWNAVFEESVVLSPEHPLKTFDRMFPNLSLKSCLVTAVSSSFSPLDVLGRAFRDNEAATAVLPLEPLNDAEAASLMTIWQHRFPSVDFRQFNMTEAMQETGGIPRLLEIYCSCMKTVDPIDERHDSFRRRCTEYFSTRLQKLEEKWSGTERMNRFVENMAELYLRRPVRNTADAVSNLWLATGLLRKRHDGQLHPVSPFVLDAITLAIQNSAREMLRILAKGTSTLWVAMELFMNYVFRQPGIHVPISARDLRGVHPCDERCRIHCRGQQLLHKSVSMDPLAYLRTHSPFPLGTCLVLWPSHPVADLVIYADCFDEAGTVPLGPQLCFIQISTSSYADHDSKVPQLAMQYPNWHASVLETYRLLFGAPPFRGGDVPRGKLPHSVRFIFITLDTSVMNRTSANSGHDVLLVCGESRISYMDRFMWNSMMK
jgi:hypothetical protein